MRRHWPVMLLIIDAINLPEAGLVTNNTNIIPHLKELSIHYVILKMRVLAKLLKYSYGEMGKGRGDQLNHFSITRPICLILEIGLLPLRTELKLSKSITVKRALCLKGVPSPSCKLGAGSSLLQLYFCQSINLISRQGTLSKKKYDIIWEFFPTWEGVFPIPKTFVN